MKRKEFSTYKALTVLFATIIIFSIGIYVGNYTTQSKFEQVLDLSKELQIQTLGVEAEHDILRENICENDNVLYLTEELADLSEKLNFMENNLGYDDARVIELKQYYFILEAKHWLLANERLKKCFFDKMDINDTIILYFYDNKNDCNDCQKQGTVLTHLQKKYTGMKIYSFDANANSPVVRVMRQLYDVEGNYPAMVINEELFEGYMDADTLEKYIQDKLEADKNFLTINATKEQ